MAAKSELNDLIQIGLTPEGQADLDNVMKSGWFPTGQDAYLLAIAVALANGVIATLDQVRGAETRYNFAGGLDRDGKVKALISTFRPSDAATPARTAERLAHAGLAVLARKLGEEDVLLSEALGYREESTGSGNE